MSIQGNVVLRRALAERRIRDIDVASSLGVDPKAVQRWLGGRRPQPRHRWALADLVGRHEYDLWPDLTRVPSISSEILATYPHRSSVPRDVWEALFGSAQEEIRILVYSGLFIAEDFDLLRSFEQKASDGVRVRILLGDPDSAHVAQRGSEECIDEAMAARVRHALVLFAPLRGIASVEIRLHDTVLYNSVYAADDQLIVNPHVYGVAAAHAPVLHLRRREARALADTYLASFDRVWATAKPL